MDSFNQPLQLVRKRIKQQIYIKLRNGTIIQGRLVAYDEHLNLMLQSVTICRNRSNPDQIQNKNLMYLRGDSVLMVGCKK